MIYAGDENLQIRHMDVFQNITEFHKCDKFVHRWWHT